MSTHETDGWVTFYRTRVDRYRVALTQKRDGDTRTVIVNG